MKRLLRSTVFAVVLFFLLPLSAGAAELLIPVGAVIGLQLQDDTVTVAAFEDPLGISARNAGLKIGDEILKIDETPIHCTDDVRSALRICDEDIHMTIRRSGKVHSIEIDPTQTAEGPRLGVYLRQGITGIGTVTFYDPETGRFGTLGHGVSSSKGNLLDMKTGAAYEASIESVIKGKSGEPGQLKGSADAKTVFGTILRNTPQGVFGVTNQGWRGEAIPVAAYDEIQAGPATIRSTVVNDITREYSVEILKIYPSDRSDGRNFLIRVTDPDLLSATGGIVQGMSGSPIIQNGKLVGAVTHVLVNSPDTGYGIYIENMLDAAG